MHTQQLELICTIPAIPEPPIMLARVSTDVCGRHNITKWPNGADWRWIWRKGLGVDVRLKNHAKPKAETPLLAILALRKQGYGVKQIVKRTGINVHTVCANIELYGVKPSFVMPTGKQGKAELWGIEYVDVEIDAHRAYELAYDGWVRKAYPSKVDHMAWYWANLDEARKLGRENAKKRYDRIKNTPEYKMKAFARQQLARIARQGRGFKKCRRTIEYLGCTNEQAAAWIAAQFSAGMSWDNYGTHWEIDHIKPLSSGDLSDKSHLSIVCHYSNLRPLSVSENRARPKPRYIRRCA